MNIIQRYADERASESMSTFRLETPSDRTYSMIERKLKEIETSLSEIVENREYLDLHRDDMAMLKRALRETRSLLK